MYMQHLDRINTVVRRFGKDNVVQVALTNDGSVLAMVHSPDSQSQQDWRNQFNVYDVTFTPANRIDRVLLAGPIHMHQAHAYKVWVSYADNVAPMINDPVIISR